VAIKDVTPVSGVRLTMGSRVFEHFVAPVDADIVHHLTGSGAIMIGKTTVPEFGLGVVSEPPIAAPARSPFDLSRSAGGSSGGSAAAVAAGMVPVAQGNDGGGSDYCTLLDPWWNPATEAQAVDRAHRIPVGI
jgi:amidase